MNKALLEQTINKIRPLDQHAMSEASRRWDGIAKPLHSLGQFEDILIQIAGMQKDQAIDIAKKALIVMCADNGVVEEGVTQTGQDVTAIVAENFLDVKSCAAIMCRQSGAEIFPVDIGMVTDTPRVEKRKVAYGTKNFAKEPAMTREQAVEAIAHGIRKVTELYEDGYRIFATGEMGIGNTTTSSAVLSCLLQVDPIKVTGRGAGLDSAGLDRKVNVIREALKKYHLIEQDREIEPDPIDILAKVGGFDIAGLAGVFIGGAACGAPVIADGFISTVSALLAVKIAPACADYILASHLSDEPGTIIAMDALGKKPILHANMHLGEGTGAVAIFPLLDMAAEIYHRMSTFSEISVEQYQELV